jgi:hypothetical protein
MIFISKISMPHYSLFPPMRYHMYLTEVLGISITEKIIPAEEPVSSHTAISKKRI